MKVRKCELCTATTQALIKDLISSDWTVFQRPGEKAKLFCPKHECNPIVKHLSSGKGVKE